MAGSKNSLKLKRAWGGGQQADLPERFLEACLDLVWILFGLGEVIDNYELLKLLVRLITGEPRLEADRRLQWLEHRVVRFD